MESRKEKMIDAQKYLDEHGIEKMVSQMLNSLLHEKSENPKVYMIKYLAGQLTKEELEQNNLVIPEPYPTPYVSKKHKIKQENCKEEEKVEIKEENKEYNIEIKESQEEAKLEEESPKNEEEELKVSNFNEGENKQEENKQEENKQEENKQEENKEEL